MEPSSRAKHVARVVTKARASALNASVFISQVNGHLATLRERTARLTDRVRRGEAVAAAHEALGQLDADREELEVMREAVQQLGEVVERRQSEAETELARYRALFALAPEATFVTEADGQVREASARAADLLGVPIDRLLGKPLAAFVVRPDVRTFRTAASVAARDGQIDGLRLGLRPRGRSPIAVDVSAVKLAEAAGDGLVWSVRERGPLLVARRRTSARADLRGLDVLVVANGLGGAATTVLRAAGARLHEAPTLAAVVDFVGQRRAHAVVCDIAQGEPTMLSLLDDCRARAPHAALPPAIALTPLGNVELARRALDAGFQMYVAKPVDAQVLAQAIAAVAGSP